jgi:hypothetical protein
VIEIVKDERREEMQQTETMNLEKPGSPQRSLKRGSNEAEGGVSFSGGR